MDPFTISPSYVMKFKRSQSISNGHRLNRTRLNEAIGMKCLWVTNQFNLARNKEREKVRNPTLPLVLAWCSVHCAPVLDAGRPLGKGPIYRGANTPNTPPSILGGNFGSLKSYIIYSIY